MASILELVGHDEGEPRKRYIPGAALRLRHRELQLRRRKSDVLHDLPANLETRLVISLQRRQRESYDSAEREGIVHLNSLGADVGVQHVLVLITRLKQICYADPKSGASSRLDDIGERLGKLADQGHKALIVSLRAGGLGLNLQEASDVFHLDRWWNPAAERQAEDRILRRKQGLFDRLVDGVSMDLSTRMNRRDQLELFGLD